MIESPTTTITGTTQNHQNSVQIILAPSPSGVRDILTPDLQTEYLFDGTGQHLGGIYPPLAIDNVLTAAHDECLATRPAQLLVHGPDCEAPRQQIGLVWMMPLHQDPVMVALNIAPWLVYALDRGMSVQVHASSDQAIAGAHMVMGAMAGGGHV